MLLAQKQEILRAFFDGQRQTLRDYCYWSSGDKYVGPNHLTLTNALIQVNKKEAEALDAAQA